MKRNIAGTMFFACMLLVNLTAMAVDDFSCSPANVAGTWGYIETATIFISGIAYPYASVGIYTLDAAGNLSGARTASAAGTTSRATWSRPGNRAGIRATSQGRQQRSRDRERLIGNLIASRPGWAARLVFCG